ncbi:MAG: OmpA family protein [Paludibacteraceae bacterium]|nr:OmpA family protein [Paludibacteraceae bacterium]
MTTKRIFSIMAAAALTLTVSAQSDLDNYIGVSFGGGLNSMLYNTVDGKSGLGFGFDAGIHYARFFNRWIGLGFGVQYTNSNANITYNWSEVTPGMVHPSNPNTPCDFTTSFNNFRERQNVGLISIPVEVMFRKVVSDNWAVIFGAGLQLDLPIYGNYIAKGGSYTTTGVFPELGPHVISDMPEHGFSTYNTAQNAKINNLAKVGGSVIADLGGRVALSKNWGLYIGIYAGYGFTNLLAGAKTETVVAINPADPSKINYNGTFDSGATDKVNLIRAGLKIAVDCGWYDKSRRKKTVVAEETIITPTDTIAVVAVEPVSNEPTEAEIAAAEAAAEAAAKAEAERLAAEAAALEAAKKAEQAAAEAHYEALKTKVESIDFHFESAGEKFNFNSNERPVVDELCEMMKADKSIKVLITGHTDNTGDAAKNLNYYGVKRAEALKNYMVSQGVSADQITCESKGQTQPVAPNTTKENRALNRRAHITVL